MAEKSKHKPSWTKILLLGASVVFTLLAIFFPAQAALAEGRTATVSVSASVALSDYFADLLATASTIESQAEPHRTITGTVTIIATEGIWFASHPLMIQLSELGTGQAAYQAATTNQHGQAVFKFTSLPPGYYQIHVIDNAYERPILLATAPTLYVAADQSPRDVVGLSLANTHGPASFPGPPAPINHQVFVDQSSLPIAWQFQNNAQPPNHYPSGRGP